MMHHDNTQLSLSFSSYNKSEPRQPLVDTKSSEQIALSVFGKVFRGLPSDSGFEFWGHRGGGEAGRERRGWREREDDRRPCRGVIGYNLCEPTRMRWLTHIQVLTQWRRHLHALSSLFTLPSILILNLFIAIFNHSNWLQLRDLRLISKHFLHP